MHCPKCNRPVWHTRSGVAYCLSIPGCTYGDLTEQERDEVNDHIWSVTLLHGAIYRPRDPQHGFWMLEKSLTFRQWRQVYASTVRHDRLPLSGAPALRQAIKSR